MSISVDADKRVDEPYRAFQRSVCGVACAVCCVVSVVCCVVRVVCCVRCVVCVCVLSWLCVLCV